jgi:hypothetical protein
MGQAVDALEVADEAAGASGTACWLRWQRPSCRYWLSAARTDCLKDLVVASTAVGS